MNRITHSNLLKIALSLFLLNSISVFLYFSSPYHNHHRETTSAPPPPPPPAVATSHDANRHFLTDEHNNNNVNYNYLKPWPILPSYLPWKLTNAADVAFRSCESHFGNGFTRRLNILPPSSSPEHGGSGSGSGWFRCYYSETLRSSICEGGSVRMVPEMIRMSRGGEVIEEVIGRQEDEELPEFQNGAFQVLFSSGDKNSKYFKNGKLVDDEFLDNYVPEGQILRHTMRDLIDSIHIVDHQEFLCDQWYEEPTILVTRFEYANLFHTITDWYSAYVSSRVTGLPYRPHLIFVDGHSRAPLEETWKALFSSVRYAKNFSGSVCFRHVVFVPLGYETALFKGLSEEIDCRGASAHDLRQNPDDRKTARLSEFGEMIRAAFGFSVNSHGPENPVSGYNILFVRREDYLAHPRHGGKVESRLSNEEEVLNALQNWASNHGECKMNIVNGLFAHMAMKDQVRTIQEASVIIGAHGAGMTHIVSATPKTVILEIISRKFRRPHFQLIAQWKGLEYHAINLAGSYVNPAVVVDKLSRIVKSLGC
ncbi:beta-1,2-xylosyltransferase [Mercurialis annua]|uniref:beta-1,2-xylosyltransferase n=1 Tax=Mercurialis annua TaxID=3986 RepID=UPI0021610A47|nr:beta-1,2-xylosyltransferase [Mercurialis annua]